jgi:hypothetical protein
MENIDKSQSFPEQNESTKLHGTHDESGQKEKYIRDSGKIEDLPPSSEVAKMSSLEDSDVDTEHVTDRSGEEKEEDYINTDERKNDINRKGL